MGRKYFSYFKNWRNLSYTNFCTHFYTKLFINCLAKSLSSDMMTLDAIFLRFLIRIFVLLTSALDFWIVEVCTGILHMPKLVQMRMHKLHVSVSRTRFRRSECIVLLTARLIVQKRCQKVRALFNYRWMLHTRCFASGVSSRRTRPPHCLVMHKCSGSSGVSQAHRSSLIIIGSHSLACRDHNAHGNAYSITV